jgi:threonine synthase
MSDTGTLVRMANQIARNYGYLAEPEAAKAVASHLKKFCARSS